MNYNEIESLKYVLTNLAKKGCVLRIPAYGVEGRVVGIGFKPYWTDRIDSKIDKLEFNLLDSLGRVVPFSFHYVTGYDIISQDDKRFENSESIALDIYVYSPNKSRDKEPSEKVRMHMVGEHK